MSLPSLNDDSYNLLSTVDPSTLIDFKVSIIVNGEKFKRPMGFLIQ